MTIPTIDSFPAAVTYVSRTTGASEEDAEKIVRAVAEFAVAQYLASQPPAAPAPQGVTMEQVKAYVDGRLEGLGISPLEQAASRTSFVLSALPDPDPDSLQARIAAVRESN